MSKELKALAEAATPGPWVQWVENAAVYAGKPEVNREGAILPSKGERIARICEGDLFDPAEQGLADHAYIAAANPSVILQLLAERDALLAERDRLREVLNALRAATPSLTCESFHHARRDQHDHDEECPPFERWIAAALACNAALQGEQP